MISLKSAFYYRNTVFVYQNIMFYHECHWLSKRIPVTSIHLKPWPNRLASQPKFVKPDLAYRLAMGGETDSYRLAMGGEMDSYRLAMGGETDSYSLAMGGRTDS